MAYICNTCEFWLHKRCALLPATLFVYNDHHHQLDLIFLLPKKHRKYRYRCDVCSKYCDASCWAYFCDECRYIAHIKCAIGSSTIKPDHGSNLNADTIEFPLHANDISDKLITPFVMRQIDLDPIPIPDTSTSNVSFIKKYFHEHSLSFVTNITHKDEKNDEEEDQKEEEDEDEDEEGDEEGELKICHACVTPISSSTPYYECADDDACKYSIRHICSLIPHTLQYSSSSSNPNSLLLLGECQGVTDKNHNFTLGELKGRDATSHWRCKLCGLPTNGMGYECKECGIKIGVKCASLPTTIRHASHTRCHHKPLDITRIQRGDSRKLCCGCDEGIHYYNAISYCCSHDGCDFALHLRCVLLPKNVKGRERDKHMLMLTFDASRDHCPSDFFCELCETEMHPKNLMYHCRPCDASFHPRCLETASGLYKNIKYGGVYKMDGVHSHHPLTFAYIMLKKSCGVCHKKWGVYTYLGFVCASCYYVVCRSCGVRELSTNMSL